MRSGLDVRRGGEGAHLDVEGWLVVPAAEAKAEIPAGTLVSFAGSVDLTLLDPNLDGRVTPTELTTELLTNLVTWSLFG